MDTEINITARDGNRREFIDITVKNTSDAVLQRFLSDLEIVGGVFSGNLNRIKNQGFSDPISEGYFEFLNKLTESLQNHLK